MKKYGPLFLLTLMGSFAAAQNPRNTAEPVDYASEVRTEIRRIDMIDGKADSSLRMFNSDQTLRATQLYFQLVPKIAWSIQGLPTAERNDALQKYAVKLHGINATNYHFLTWWENNFRLLQYLYENKGSTRELEYLKNNINQALDCLPFFINRPYATDFLLYSSAYYPFDVLSYYRDYQHLPGALQIVEAAGKQDPNALKQYFSSGHDIYYLVQRSKDSVMKVILDIWGMYGSRSLSYTNVHLLQKQSLTLQQSEDIIRDPDVWLGVLIKLRKQQNILGAYAVDDQLEHLCLKPVMRVNELHDENDDIRFARVKGYSAEELYTMLVYTREEIFTSTFLGLYKRMMQRRPDSSGYQFLRRMGMNRFRTFVTMCAAYNTLQPFMNTMQPMERKQLVNDVVDGIDHTGGDLSAAVEVADIYGSLSDTTLRKQLRDALEDHLMEAFVSANRYGQRLYGLLLKLCGGNPEAITGKSISFVLPELDKIETGLLFPDGKNVQQHLFYDDEDGNGAFNAFSSRYKDANWITKDMGSYVIIESKVGNKVQIYANKPSSQDAGMKAIKASFEKQNRWPDVVVHRGHSYYMDNTIGSLTNNVKVAILGSCGGYKNISSVLDRSTDAQIVSSKQIGTGSVNNVLVKDFTEMLRTQKSVDWRKLWSQLDVKLKTNPRWVDYVPPYRNLGVKFVKAFLASE